MTRIFVSSTIYDLIDTRSEIETTLRQVGLSPILSDSTTSDFTVFPDRASIETCLSNVRNSDYFLMILSKRYGPTLESIGYPKVSATHLEYLEAKENKVPIFVYVRDRLEAEYRIWRQNEENRPSLKLPWCETKDFLIFQLLHDHQKAEKSERFSNWYSLFSSSVDLKTQILKDLHIPIRKYLLNDLFQKNQIPFFSINIEPRTNGIGNNFLLEINCYVENSSMVPAYNFEIFWPNEKNEMVKGMQTAVLPPGKCLPFSFTRVLTPDSLTFKCRYKTKCKISTGHVVQDEFLASISIILDSGLPKTTAFCESIRRNFEEGEPIEIEI